MLNTTLFPISPKPVRRLRLPVARSPYPCPHQATNVPSRIGGMGRDNRDAMRGAEPHGIHARELNETQAPEALADSAFAMSTWWSLREGARRILSRFHVS